MNSIPSKFGAASGVDAPTSPESLRPIKIIVISDFVSYLISCLISPLSPTQLSFFAQLCGFCYICDKVLHEAIEACRDLPVRFDVEFRPFMLANLPIAAQNQVVYRNAYVTQKFGREQAEIKLKAVSDLGQKAGLKLSVSRSIIIISSNVLSIQCGR